MDIGKAIYKILNDNIAVSSMVGTRIAPNVMKQTSAFPFIVYDVSSDEPEGQKDSVALLDTANIMVSAYCKTYSEASKLANYIRTALDRVNGVYNAVNIQAIDFDGYDDVFDDMSGSDGIYRKSLNFNIRIINSFNNIYSTHFDGVDDFVSLGVTGMSSVKNTGSISAWFKLDVNANGAIFSNWHGGLSVNYLLRYKSTNPIGIQWYIYSGGTTSRLDTGYTPTFGAWTHVVAVKDPITNGGQSRVYINGVQAGTPLNDTTLSSLMPNINREDQIGVYNTGSDFTNGNISNVAYWTNTALTESQAEEIYNNGKTIDLNNLTFTAPTHWLPLDERSVYFNGSTLQARDIINNVDGNGINLKEENIVGDAPGSTSNGTGNNIDILDLKGDTSISSKNAYSINMADYADGITNPANSGRSTNTP